ncbi:MAG: xanthine dehydrogenase family protein molybdopterin-binding subunit [Streptosporangiales bacterium]|nr:xanthine dehydrogenase family protein molybdopterin-binding subunit [Streptosporangiales bacterium]
MSGPAVGGAARYAGTRVHRVEDTRLLTGTGTFADDVTRAGLLHAFFVRSPHARAAILSVDATEALALPGVIAVFTAADLNGDIREQWYTIDGPDIPDTPRPPLADGMVRYVGDPVALVVAEDRYIAEDAAELVMVDYDPLDPVVDYATARESEVLVHDAYPGNVAGEIPGAPFETLDEVCDGAAHVLTETIREQGQAAVPMEGRGLTAEWSGGELTLWSASQAPHEVRLFASRLLGVPEHKVRTITRDVGGGFGQKVVPQREEMCVLLAVRKVPGPLKWTEDRQENLLSAGQARHEHGDVRMAFADDGTMLATSIDHTDDVGSYPTPWPVGPGIAVGMMFPGPYRVAAGTFKHTSMFSNTVGRTAYRGPWAFETLARELCLDIAARRMGIDPAELRRRNILRRDEMPYSNPVGMPYDHMSPNETFEQALSILGYEEFRKEQAAARAEGRYLGVGISTYVEPTASAMPYYGSEGATIRVEPSGKINVYMAGGSTGNSLETTAVMLTADALGARIEDVSTIQGDTAVTPFGPGTGGSRSGPMIAGAVGETASILRERLLAIAAGKLEADVADVELSESSASVKGDPDASVTFAEIANLAYFQPAALPPGVPAGLEASARYAAQAMMLWANATHVCTCEVDTVTGAVKLLRYIVSEDCGPMINPNLVEGQIAGGVVQGIGGALMEHLAYDEDGNPVSTTFMDYMLPTSTEVPVIEYGHVETPGPNPGGYKGVGEGGAIGAPAAVANAVADALSPFGVTVTQLPLTPDAIVGLISSAGGAS